MASITRDPVCGMPVDPATAGALGFEGARYWFCSEHCLDAFGRSPAACAGRCSGAPGRGRATATDRVRQDRR